MNALLGLAVVALLAPALALAQPAGENRELGKPGSAGPKDDRSVVQQGDQPSPAEVRPGNRDGDSPSASAGDLVRRQTQRRILGLPATAALLIGGAIVVLFIIGGVAIPATRRRARARGNGTYGPPS